MPHYGFGHLPDGPNTDAFGRLRVGQPHTIFDSKYIFDAEPLVWDDQQTSGDGTSSTFSANRASVTLAVSNLTAGTRVRQTFRRMRYEPGKSQLINMTFVLGVQATGITKRIGCFSSNNGIFLQQTSAGLALVRRSNVTGTPVDTVALQSSWSQDPLDGTGPSRLTLDPTKAQLMQIDYQWLGTGAIRVGFYLADKFIPAHTFLAANTLSSVWASTGSFPLRVEISNSGTGPVASIEAICSAVISEGGTESVGTIYSISSGITPVACASIGTAYAVGGLRLQSTAKGTNLNLLRVTLADAGPNDVFCWQARLNPTVAGTFAYTAVPNASVEMAAGSATNTVTGGVVIDSGYAMSKAEVTISPTSLVRLGFSIADVPDAIVFCCTPVVGTNQNIYVSLTWQELI